MGLLDSIGLGSAASGSGLGLPGVYVADNWLDVTGRHGRKRLSDYEGAQAQARAQAKQSQLQALANLRGPQVTPQMTARMQALEEQSKAQPLATDPFMQAQRAQLVRGGASELASVQNKQKAYGVEGGYKNVGSIGDIYDRMGGQLAQLGQQQTEMKDVKSQQAAEMRQGIADAQIAYDNSIIQAQMAIEAGDAQAAQQAMAQAYAAREQIQNNQRQMVLSIGGSMLTAATGMPKSSGTTQAPAAVAGPAQSPGGYVAPQSGNLAITQGEYGSSYSKLPWAAQKRSYA